MGTQYREMVEGATKFWCVARPVALGLWRVFVWCLWLVGVILSALAGVAASSSSSSSREHDLWEDDGVSDETYTDGLGNKYHRDPFDSKLRDCNGKSAN